MSTSLAGENLGKAVLLSLTGSLVQIKGSFPITIYHIPWTVNIERHIEPF